MSRVAVNGVHLEVDLRGQGPAVLLLHGFTGSRTTWARHVSAWPGLATIAVDLLGHGRSDCPAEAGRYRMEHCIEDLVELLDRLRVDRVAALGYSMGGRIALHLALRAPERLWAMVLESTSPGIQDPHQRDVRARADAALAEAIERHGIEAFIEHWEALPLFATQRRLADNVRTELRRQRLQNDPRGIANTLRGLGQGVQESLAARLGEIRVPVLVMTGREDRKYRGLARELAARLPRARLAIVPEAGHAVHLEQPERFRRTVQEFLEECLRREERRNGRCR